MRSFIPALALTSSLILVARARADVVALGWADEETYVYEVIHMPDLDQVRCGSDFPEGGLPNCGSMYCVPTSLVNLLAYAANHGFPELPPGEAFWEWQANYVEASSAIRTMGILAGTDPEDGTGHDGAAAALSLWLQTSGKFVMEDASATQFWAPTIDHLAASAITGSIVAFCYGRYNIVQETEGLVQVGSRTGGHCVTLARLARSGDEMIIESRDPAADEGDAFAQSAFGNTGYTVRNHAVFRTGSNPFVRPMTSLNHPVGDGKIRLIDGIYTIRPKSSYSWSPSSLPQITIHAAASLDDLFDQDVVHTIAPIGHTLLGAGVIGSQTLAAITISPAGGAVLRRVNLVDDTSDFVEVVPSASRLAVGRRGQIYVLTGTEIRCYDPDAEPPLTASVAVANATDLAFDDEKDELLVYAPSERKILHISPDLLRIIPCLLPEIVPVAATGEIRVGQDSAMWVHPGGVTALYKALLPAAGGPPVVQILSHSSLAGLTSFDADDTGRVFACVGGVVREFYYNPVVTRWEPAIDSPSGLNATECDGSVMIARNRSNFDAATMVGPEWFDLDPSEVLDGPFFPDCPGDLDADGIVDLFDLLLVLSDWGGCAGCRTDIDNSGAVGLGDLLITLAAWGPCE